MDLTRVHCGPNSFQMAFQLSQVWMQNGFQQPTNSTHWQERFLLGVQLKVFCARWKTQTDLTCGKLTLSHSILATLMVCIPLVFIIACLVPLAASAPSYSATMLPSWVLTEIVMDNTRTCPGAGTGNTWATSLEVEYPTLLCNAIAQVCRGISAATWSA